MTKRLTLNVVTLWYRPPELLLGAKGLSYDQKVDLWSAGCVAAEMFKSSGSLFTGEIEGRQVDQIWDVLGKVRGPLCCFCHERDF